MRLLITILLFASSVVSMYGQDIELSTVEVETPANDVFQGVEINMPNLRQTSSGTKFLVTYSGNWPEEMKGAFEYAVKMWEEVIPSSLPISITASIQPIRGTNAPLSRTSYTTRNFNHGIPSGYASTTSQVKNVLFQEYHKNMMNLYYDELTDASYLTSPHDITITYNENRISEFSFSLDGELEDKYDFITLALRDIGYGLGCSSSLTADSANQQVFYPAVRVTPYTQRIMEALGLSGTDNQSTAYQKGTQGHLLVDFYGRFSFGPLSASESQTTSSTEMDLYAPSPWINSVSLNTTIPGTHPLSKLFNHDFGKGYVMRDLSGYNWDTWFRYALKWDIEIITGITNKYTVEEAGTTENELSFNDAIVIESLENPDGENPYNVNYPEDDLQKSIMSQQDVIGYGYYFTKPYEYFYTGKNNYKNGIALNVMLKNGTWDCIFATPDPYSGITLNVEDLPLNYDKEMYARSIGGGLRYRLTRCTTYHDNLYDKDYKHYDVTHFTRDYYPQKPVIKYSKVHEGIATFSNDDDYFVDVEIGISNLEGAQRVMVNQWDEGERYPFSYEVTDFRKGYFLANLDRELETKLSITVYNENGYEQSNQITIAPIGYGLNDVDLMAEDSSIVVKGVPNQVLSKGGLTCLISNVLNPLENAQISVPKDGVIDISQFSNGIYGVSLIYNGEPISNKKIVKK